MEFWKAYFTVIEVLKGKVAIYEEVLSRWPESAELDQNNHNKKMSSAKAVSFVPKTILVVEPLEKNRVLIARYLSAFSVKVEFVKSEDEAQVKAASGDYDLKINTTGLGFPDQKNTLIEQL